MVVIVAVVAPVELDFEFHVALQRPSVNFAIEVVVLHFDD